MQKNVLITGANGFIAKNLLASLENDPDLKPLCYIRERKGELERLVSECHMVCHLAAICRHPSGDTLIKENLALTDKLLEALQREKRKIPVLFASSTQAASDTPYGLCKREEEKRITAYGEITGSEVSILRLPGVFGKWSRPHYNSVVATFCHQVAHGFPITVEQPDKILKLCYIDDVVDGMIKMLKKGCSKKHPDIEPYYTITVGKLAEHIYHFEKQRTTSAPSLKDPLLKKLYSTYISFLPGEKLSYPLTAHRDERGLFAEFLRSDGCGQVSINHALPGITKGGHVHRLKYEKFLVVAGDGVIRLRKQGETEIHTFSVSGKLPQVVEIPPGYVHDITNSGADTLVFVIWANENFDPQHPDTYREEVMI